MRLSTAPDRDDERGVAVIHAALDAGATLLDSADAYCFDDRDTGHNERLVARALAAWPGDRSRITVATKGGIRRPKGAWVSDGRAKHLREACEASRRAQYLLLYTRGDLVGFSLPRGGGGPLSNELHWTERSIDAKLEIEIGAVAAK